MDVEELERRLLARQQELKEIRDSRRALEEKVDAGKQELQELEIKLAKWKKDTSAERKANMTFIHESLLISELGGPLRVIDESIDTLKSLPTATAEADKLLEISKALRAKILEADDDGVSHITKLKQNVEGINELFKQSRESKKYDHQVTLEEEYKLYKKQQEES